MMDALKLAEHPELIRDLAKELATARIAPHQLRNLEVSFRHVELHLSGEAFAKLKAAAVELLHAVNAIEDRDFVEATVTGSVPSSKNWKMVAIEPTKQAYAPSLSSCQKCAECWHYDTHTATCWLPERMDEHTPRRPDFPACAGFVSAKGKANEILQEIEMENDEF